MDRPTCETCPFWDGPDEDEVWLGICRKHAPTPAEREFPAWPKTLEDEWCGEHPDFAAWIASAKPG